MCYLQSWVIFRLPNVKKIHFLTFTTLIPMLMGVEMCVEYQCVLLVILETFQTCLSGARAPPKGCCLVIAM